MTKDSPPDYSGKQSREEMPLITAWIDSLRCAFGTQSIDASIRQGLQDGTFWAMENGKMIGAPPAFIQQRIENEWQASRKAGQ